MKKILMYPSKNLVYAIPIVLLLGFILGLNVSLISYKSLILPLTFFMIYPTMIGFNIKKVVDLSNTKLILTSLVVNFLLIPIIAFIVGRLCFADQAELYIGLIMIALFPTSGMTISWTSLSKGNVTAAVTIVAISLLVGAFIAPLYLAAFVGNIVEINIVKTFLTVIQIVIIPLILGNITYKLILKKMTQEKFQKEIKPILPAISVWAMLIIVMLSVGMKAKTIASNPSILLSALIAIVVFYGINYIVITFVSRKIFAENDSYALLYGTVMRNLSVALGVAVASFSPDTALLITIAYVLQIQSAAWYGMLSKKYHWLKRGSKKVDLKKGEAFIESDSMI